MADVLVITPHPDDEAYAFGGLMALAADAGFSLAVECASAGEKGERHDGGPDGEAALAQARLRELAESCAVLGAEEATCWGLPDGGLAESESQAARIVKLCEEHGARLVLTLGADGAYGHPDHMALHGWVVEAWKAMGAGAPALLFAAFPKGLFVPQWEKCRDMLGEPPNPSADSLGTARPDIALAISEVTDRKLAAIGSHRSQLPGGDPLAIFPPGIVAGTLREEWYSVGHFTEGLEEMLRAMVPGN